MKACVGALALWTAGCAGGPVDPGGGAADPAATDGDSAAPVPDDTGPPDDTGAPAGPCTGVRLGEAWTVAPEAAWSLALAGEVVWLVGPTADGGGVRFEARDPEGASLGRTATWSDGAAVSYAEAVGAPGGDLAVLVSGPGQEDIRLLLGRPDGDLVRVDLRGGAWPRVVPADEGWLVVDGEEGPTLRLLDAAGAEQGRTTLSADEEAVHDLVWLDGRAGLVLQVSSTAARGPSRVEVHGFAGEAPLVFEVDAENEPRPAALARAGADLLVIQNKDLEEIRTKKSNLETAVAGQWQTWAEAGDSVVWPDADAVGDGQLAVWTWRAAGGGRVEVQGRFLDAAGAPLGPAAALVTAEGCDLWYPDVQPGGLLTWWEYCPEASPTTRRVATPLSCRRD